MASMATTAMAFITTAQSRWPRRIRPVLQMERADCGAACLSMALAAHGKQLPLAQTRTVLDGGRDGVTALDIVRAARAQGLEGGGYAVRSYLKPFADWLWLGGMLMAFGGTLSLTDRRYRVAAGARRPVGVPAE